MSDLSDYFSLLEDAVSAYRANYEYPADEVVLNFMLDDLRECFGIDKKVFPKLVERLLREGPQSDGSH